MIHATNGLLKIDKQHNNIKKTPGPYAITVDHQTVVDWSSKTLSQSRVAEPSLCNLSGNIHVWSLLPPVALSPPFLLARGNALQKQTKAQSFTIYV